MTSPDPTFDPTFDPSFDSTLETALVAVRPVSALPASAATPVASADASVTEVPPPTARRARSDDLLAGERELEIDHAGSIYRLRVTATGKLILTK